MNVPLNTPNEAQANFLRPKIIDVLDIHLCCGSIIKDDADFIDDLHADSLDQLEMVMALEDEFEFEISDEESEEMKTLDSTMRILHARLTNNLTRDFDPIYAALI